MSSKSEQRRRNNEQADICKLDKVRQEAQDKFAGLEDVIYPGCTFYENDFRGIV